MRLFAWALLLVLAGCAATAPQSAPTSAATAPQSSAATPDDVSPSPASTPAISREEAVDVARSALREAGEDWDVVSAESGPLEQMMPEWEDQEWASGLAADLAVWRVVMESGDLSAEVLLDYLDGSVYHSVLGVAN